jgi:HPt (histidine-containing phosphotransfer) domain-containing protein
MENRPITSTSPAASPAVPLYNLSMLEELDGDDYLLEMLEILIVDLPKDVKEMKAAAMAGKADIICTKAHKLKSSAAVIQAVNLALLLEDIEACGKKDPAAQELYRMIDTAVDLFGQIEKGLKIDAARLAH